MFSYEGSGFLTIKCSSLDRICIYAGMLPNKRAPCENSLNVGHKGQVKLIYLVSAASDKIYFPNEYNYNNFQNMQKKKKKKDKWEFTHKKNVTHIRDNGFLVLHKLWNPRI